MNPQARKDRLVIEELPEETLIYDQERHKAHCLNQTAAFVWGRCDGRTSVDGLAKALEDELGIPVLDGVTCAVKMAEAVVELGQSTSKAKTYRFPESKAFTGVFARFGADTGQAAAAE